MTYQHNHRSFRLAGQSTLFLALILSLSGCFSLLGLGGNNNSSAEEETEEASYPMDISFVNQSGEPLCGIEIVQADHTASHWDRVEPGGTVSFTLESRTDDLFVTACDGDRFLFAETMPSFEGSTFTFASTNPQTFQERLNYIIQLNRMQPMPPMNEPGLEARMLEVTQQRAQSAGWIDTPTVVLNVSPEWAIYRNNRTGIITMRRAAGIVGHRFPDGHCSIQMHTYVGQHNGSDFMETQYEGVAGNIFAGCKMLDWMEARVGVSGSAPSRAATPSSGGGGMCTNTCSSANDGECDDGGPNSLYNVCSLGTDCGDCGPR